MRFSTYLSQHGSNPRKFAAQHGFPAYAVYRWWWWDLGNGRKQAAQPGPDEIQAIQRATGGLVTLFDWTTRERDAAITVSPSTDAA